MPTIDCALNSAPLEESEDKKSVFIIALMLLFVTLKTILHRKKKGEGKHSGKA